ncbi:MAG TPA: alpha-amylase family glycosyl hydrolase [Chthoniobacterales bacterium]|nr:alpha-amylase family glycosyl hydrolase [Chthoniobacterales bacterium]
MPGSINNREVREVFEGALTLQSKRVMVDGRAVDVAMPFPSPEDWRDQWIYFLMVDRFNNPSAPPKHAPFDGTHGVFQGGTLNGVRQKLDYLKELGVGAIWLSPVQKNCQYNPFTFHGYGIQDFLEIDPRFASDPVAAKADPKPAEDELRALVDEAHARGIYVIFDIVLNHAGDVFEYVLNDGRRAAETDFRDQPYTINWRDETGRGRPDWTEAPADPPRDAAIWPAELRRNDAFRRKGRGGEAGGDFSSLKEMVTDLQVVDDAIGRHFPVRNALIRAYQYLIAKFDVDGFRIDTLKYIEPEFAQSFGNSMREFALAIGKKNFFTFGEVYDNEEQITRFIGRQATEQGDLVGVDAALDFPLFFKLPGMAKGQTPPAEVVQMFEHRKELERGVISSHGEASRFFVTFLDNHDQQERFYFSGEDAPGRFEDQLILGIGCLFTLQGIPCLYYGTEQGLHGRGNGDAAVREALWGKPNAFDEQTELYGKVQRLAAVRGAQPALRYGRQYFRPISSRGGAQFGISPFSPGVLAFSRILNDQEILVVANCNTEASWTGEVIVDFSLNPAGSTYEVLFTNKTVAGAAAPGPVVERSAGSIEIHEVNGSITNGPTRVLSLTLREMEIQILGKRS